MNYGMPKTCNVQFHWFLIIHETVWEFEQVILESLLSMFVAQIICF